MRQNAIIVDIDGTVADCSHRLHYIDRSIERADRDWDKFYAACQADEPIYDMIDLILTIQATGGIVLFVTGRSDSIRIETAHWLRRYFDLEYDCMLFMRSAGDHRPDYIVKREIYEKFIHNRFNIKYVFEDRDQCVQMWRELGLLTLQPADGSF